MNRELNIEVRRTITNGKVVEMVDMEEYQAHPERYLERNDVGILIKSEDHDQDVVLPLRNNYNGNPISPGVYNAGPIDFTIMPDEANYQKYVPERVVCLNNKMDAKRIIETGNAMSRLDEPFITTPDHITNLPINEDDQPEMRALKMALNAKRMDLDKYAGRFSDNFPNDKRQLKNNSVTLNILKRFCNNMDMEAILTIRDRNPNVPNPIGEEISISLTDEFVDDEDSEY